LSERRVLCEAAQLGAARRGKTPHFHEGAQLDDEGAQPAVARLLRKRNRAAPPHGSATWDRAKTPCFYEGAQLDAKMRT
jgi:hypothetical protein